MNYYCCINLHTKSILGFCYYSLKRSTHKLYNISPLIGNVCSFMAPRYGHSRSNAPTALRYYFVLGIINIANCQSYMEITTPSVISFKERRFFQT